jgi:hypothetical protein
MFLQEFQSAGQGQQQQLIITQLTETFLCIISTITHSHAKKKNSRDNIKI